MSGFTLRQLEIFAQVVEHGSFRRCAEALGVSQVSISEHVRELETRLGVKLFDRNAGGPATLTPEGTRAHARIVAILADLNDLMWEAGGAQSAADRRRSFSVAMHPFMMRYMRDAFAGFKTRHPDIDVKVDLALASLDSLHERIQSRALDLGFFFAFDGHEIPGSDLVRFEPLAIYVGQDHPLAKKDVVTAADIRAIPAIHLAPTNPLRIVVDRALEQAGASGSPIGVEADEYGLILTSVQHNHGFACMFESSASEVSKSSGLVRVSLDHAIPALQVRRITRHSARHDAINNELIELLTKTLKDG